MDLLELGRSIGVIAVGWLQLPPLLTRCTALDLDLFSIDFPLARMTKR